MSAPLEKIIRPHQLESVMPPRRLPDTQQGGVGPVKIMAGRGGSGTTLSGSFSSTVTVYCDAHQVEQRL